MEQYLLLGLVGAVCFALGYAVCWAGTWLKLARVETGIRSLSNQMHDPAVQEGFGELDAEWLGDQLDALIHKEFA